MRILASEVRLGSIASFERRSLLVRLTPTRTVKADALLLRLCEIRARETVSRNLGTIHHLNANAAADLSAEASPPRFPVRSASHPSGHRRTARLSRTKSTPAGGIWGAIFHATAGKLGACRAVASRRAGSRGRGSCSSSCPLSGSFVLRTMLGGHEDLHGSNEASRSTAKSQRPKVT